MLGSFVLLRRIAVGGMAEVFEARASGARDGGDDTVALKVLLPHLARDPEFVRMLADEAKVAAALSHPNLVRVYQFGVADGQPFLAMELVRGLPLSDLEAYLRRRGARLPPSLAVLVVSDLLRALDYVHSARDPEGTPLGIVHRDVTPQNVLLGRQGDVRLGDFGIARSNVRNVRTRTGIIKGKLRYLAPEQVTGSSIDERTDLYAAGLVLHELLTGEPFLRGETEIDLLRAADAPPYRRVADAGVDPRFDALLQPALQRFPEERWPSARAFLEALDQLGAQLGLAGVRAELASLVRESAADLAREVPPPVDAAGPEAAPTRPATPASRMPPRGPTGRRRAVVVLGLAAVGVTVLGIATRPSPHAPTHAPVAERRASPAPWPAPQPPPIRPRPVPVADETPPAPPPPIAAARRPRKAVAAPSPAPTPEPHPTPAPPPADEARRWALGARLDAVRGALQSRGVLVEDLPPDSRAALRNAPAELAAGRLDDADRDLGRAEIAARGLRVDAAFVRAKLDRVDAAMGMARRAGADVAGLEGLAATALQDFLEGRYEVTNRRLNEILRALARSQRAQTPVAPSQEGRSDGHTPASSP